MPVPQVVGVLQKHGIPPKKPPPKNGKVEEPLKNGKVEKPPKNGTSLQLKVIILLVLVAILRPTIVIDVRYLKEPTAEEIFLIQTPLLLVEQKRLHTVGTLSLILEV